MRRGVTRGKVWVYGGAGRLRHITKKKRIRWHYIELKNSGYKWPSPFRVLKLRDVETRKRVRADQAVVKILCPPYFEFIDMQDAMLDTPHTAATLELAHKVRCQLDQLSKEAECR